MVSTSLPAFLLTKAITMSRKPSKMLELLPPAAALRKHDGDTYQPFPLDALPAPIAGFVREGAAALGCDAACLALPVLAVVAGVIGSSRSIRLKEGTEEPCVIWSAVVDEGDNRVAAALRRALAYLLALQKKAFLDFRQLRQNFQNALKRWRGPVQPAIDVWGLGYLEEEMPKGPVLQRLVCSHMAIDKLAVILEENPRGVLIARDELNGWLASFLRPRGARAGRDPSLWLEMHRAGSFYFERTCGDRAVFLVPRAAASLTGTLSPAILSRALKADGPASAVAACFLLAMPPRAPMIWSPAAIDPATEGAFNALLDGLFRLELDQCRGEWVPHVLDLTAEAAAAWAEFYNAHDVERDAPEGVLAASVGRMQAYAARFALIDHVLRSVQGGEGGLAAVGVQSIEAGVTLCDWFAAETRRVYAKVFESAEERNAAGIVELIRGRGGRINIRQLMRASWRRYPDAETAELALDRLVELGLGRWLESSEKKLTA
jgi:hypothetical protein